MSTPREPSTPLGARYHVLKQLGEGGFGRTYLAEDMHRFNERCVLKEFIPQVEDPNLLAKAKELFEREAGILYQLEHPQIPKFRELLRDEDRLFLVQDYAEGPTYRTLLQNRQDYGGHFSETEIVQLLHQLLPVLEYIHGLNIIHRDISPENLILRSTDGQPVLIDFGSVKQIAASVEQELTTEASKTRIGKAGYVPPEQFSTGAVDATSDLYGLAATLVVLATGKEPQDLYDNYAASWDWSPYVTLSAPLNQVLHRMLAPSPAQRYPSAAAVMQALGKPSEVPSPADPEEPAADAPDMTDMATQVVAAPAPTTEALEDDGEAAYSSSEESGGLSGCWQAGIGLLAVLGISSLLLVFLLSNLPRFGGGRQEPTPEEPTGEPAELTPEEIARQQTIQQRREGLGVNAGWFENWVNQQFYQQYPNLQGRSLTSSPEDAPLRLRWDNLALDSLDLLERQLSMPARRGLGAYSAGDRERWRNAVNRLNVSSRALEDLADAKFSSIFSGARREEFIDQPAGQIWYALAEDDVRALTSGQALEQIQFAPEAYSQRVTGQLAPGEGQVFTLNLQAGQILRLNLQAPRDSTLLSLYVPNPSEEIPFLLSDSSTTTSWPYTRTT